MTPTSHCACVLCTTQNVSGNATKSGIAKGDTIVYASSFFGDELWPTDSKSLTQSALTACPSPVALVYVRFANPLRLLCCMMTLSPSPMCAGTLPASQRLSARGRLGALFE